MKKESQIDSSAYGAFPSYAVVVYKGYDPRWRGRGDPIRAWRIDSESVKEIPLPPPGIDINRRSGMYYAMGFFTFSFPEDMSVARVSMTLGPRYGRGYSLKIVISDGEIELGDRFDEWAS